MSEIQDQEETPQSKTRKKIAKEYHKKKKEKGIKAQWYIMQGKKLVQCTISNSGNMYRVYLGQITSNKIKNQELLAMIEDLKEKGQLKEPSWRP